MNQNLINKSKVMHFKRFRTPIKVTAILRMDIKLALTCLLFSVVLISACKTNKDIVKAEKPKSAIAPDGFGQRLVELQQKIDTVETSLQQAEGLAQNRGRIDLMIAKYFAGYIDWELNHPDIMLDALAANDFFDEQETLSPAQRDQRYHEHIDRELTDATALMDQAMEQLSKDVRRTGLDPILWRDMVYKDGNFHVDGHQGANSHLSWGCDADDDHVMLR